MESFRRSRNRRRPPQRVELDGATRPTSPTSGSGRPAEGAAVVGEDLHVCPRCTSPFVQPVEWVAVDSGRWRVALLCPECGWSGGGVFAQKVLDRYDEVLDDGAATLVHELHELTQANMLADVEAFCAALDEDLIQPDDF